MTWLASALAWLGGLALALLLAREIQKYLSPWREARRKRLALKKASELDWSFIDNTLNAPRPRRDCERQESLGICTGRECLVYDGCDFNIKKVVH